MNPTRGEKVNRIGFCGKIDWITVYVRDTLSCVRTKETCPFGWTRPVLGIGSTAARVGAVRMISQPLTTRGCYEHGKT